MTLCLARWKWGDSTVYIFDILRCQFNGHCCNLPPSAWPLADGVLDDGAPVEPLIDYLLKLPEQVGTKGYIEALAKFSRGEIHAVVA
jgi:hypothetical protein